MLRSNSNNNNRKLPTPGLGYVSSQTKPTKKHNGYAYVMLSYPRYSKGLESSTLEELREWWGLECEVLGEGEGGGGGSSGAGGDGGEEIRMILFERLN